MAKGPGGRFIKADNGNGNVQPQGHGNDGQNEHASGSDSGNNSGTGTVIEPSAIAGTGTDGDSGNDQPRRKRGRPAGSASRKTSAKSSLALKDVLASALFVGHVALAGALKTPRLVIEEGEADKLSAALDQVLSHYINVNVDERTRDWINLAMVAGAIYGPRVFAAMNENKKPAPDQVQPRPSELKPTAPQTQTIKIPGVPGEHEVPMQ